MQGYYRLQPCRNGSFKSTASLFLPEIFALLDILLINLADIYYVPMFQELLAMRSDAPFRDAKAKLMEIKQELSKRSGRLDGDERRKKKRKKAAAES